MYKIESGVPLLLSREERYPFGSLEIGQSFVFQPHDVHAVRSAAQWVGKKLERKFSVKKCKAEGVGRCWRIS